MGRLGTYWHTLKYLKPVQIWGRLRHRLPRNVRWADPLPGLSVPVRQMVEPARLPTPYLGEGRFHFIGETRDLGEPIDWAAPGASLLWQYNLHYFDCLGANGAADAARRLNRLIESWIAANVPGSHPAWDPYPTSLRIVNWVKWAIAQQGLQAAMGQSLALQARWLERHLEWHLLGNHLFANAKALVFAGCMFDGAEPTRWLAKGARIIGRELTEQVLADGGNFELSPMYHAIFLTDLLDLVNLDRSFPGKLAADMVESLRTTAARMLGWLAAMSHPDGEIALFNDSAIGIASNLGALTAYAARLDIAALGPKTDRNGPARMTLLTASGYARLEVGQAVAFCDVAQVGPDHLPGHAHADTLSFELSIAGNRVIVNGGTSRYGADAARLAERGTRSHSTVTVDDADSSEVWSGFRVARRARPTVESASLSDVCAALTASHDGYRRLGGGAIHRRTWRLQLGRLEIADVVTGTWGHAYAQFLLHSDIDVTNMAHGKFKLRHKHGGPEIVFSADAGEAVLVDTAHATAFADRRPTRAICVKLVEGQSLAMLDWTDS